LARRKKKGKHIVLNKYKVGIALIALGGLFFFCFILAKTSPLLSFFTDYASVPFGEIGLLIFFGLSVVVGSMILAK